MSHHLAAIWASAISREDRIDFTAEAERIFGKAAANIEEVTLSYRADIAVGQRNSDAGSPYELKILQEAAGQADADSIVCRTQDPLLDGTNRLPGDMVIGIFGAGARFTASQASAAADTADLLAISQALDDGVLQCRQGALRKFEVPGDEFMSYGVGNEVQVEGTNENNFGVKDRGWRKLKPTIFGKDQQLLLSMFWNRTSDWPQAFSIRFMFPALIARIK